MSNISSKNDKLFSSLNEYFGVENTKWENSDDVCWEDEEKKDPVSRVLNISEKYGRKTGGLLTQFVRFLNPIFQKIKQVAAKICVLSFRFFLRGIQFIGKIMKGIWHYIRLKIAKSKNIKSIYSIKKQQIMAQVPKIKKQGEEILNGISKSRILQKVQNMSSLKDDIPVEKVKQVQNRFQQAFRSYLNQNEKIEETPKPRKYFGGLYS